MTRISLSREELYEMVWNKPINHWAPEYGLSDRGFGKLCARMEVPVPGRGYWQKLKRGYKVKKEALPKPSDKCERFASIWVAGKARREAAKQAESDSLVLQVKTFENQPKNQIIVPDRIHKFHLLVKNTLEALRSGGIDDYGRSHSYGENKINVSCSKEMAPRVARFLHTLIRALEARGHQLIVRRDYSEYSPGWSEIHTYIQYAGEEIKISLIERATRFDRPANSSYSWRKYDYLPSGNLYLETSFPGCYSGKQNWSDSPKKRLEDQMNSMMIDLAKIAVHLKHEREQREQETRAAETRRQEAELLRQHQLEEEQRIEYLEELYAGWFKAKQLREFLDLVEQVSIELKPIDMEKEEWLMWARNYANRIDPLIK